MKARLSLVWLCCLVVASGALAQAARPGALPGLGPAGRLDTLLNSLGSGQSAPHARVLFYEIDEELCVFVGAKREPNTFSAQTLVLRLENPENRQFLKFPFKGKADHIDDDFFVWERCLPTPEVADGSKIRVEIRPRKARERHDPIHRQNLYHLIDYPSTEAKLGVDIYRTSTGSYSWAQIVEP